MDLIMLRSGRGILLPQPQELMSLEDQLMTTSEFIWVLLTVRQNCLLLPSSKAHTTKIYSSITGAINLQTKLLSPCQPRKVTIYKSIILMVEDLESLTSMLRSRIPTPKLSSSLMRSQLSPLTPLSSRRWWLFRWWAGRQGPFSSRSWEQIPKPSKSPTIKNTTSLMVARPLHSNTP